MTWQHMVGYLLLQGLARELEAHLQRPQFKRQNLAASQLLPVLATRRRRAPVLGVPPRTFLACVSKRFKKATVVGDERRAGTEETDSDLRWRRRGSGSVGGATAKAREEVAD